uniref:RING-type domain-containing protein n=1 Tax=Meloidogyne incognita TaxID=6306 RepID=A0A914NLY8_MELIC
MHYITVLIQHNFTTKNYQNGTFEIEGNEDIQCRICLDNIEKGQLAQSTPCTPIKHIFHVNCFWTWYKDHHNCPFCRKAFLIKFIEFLDPPKNKTKKNDESSNRNW